MTKTIHSEPDLSELLPCAAQAAFNSAEKQHDPFCLPETRVDLLERIMLWADSGDQRCLFWLHGEPCSGKSTIARTVAREFYDQGRLGASFFFSRGGGDASHAGKFFNTIAVQLSTTQPILKRYMHEAIWENTGTGLQEQWNQLVRRPLSKIYGLQNSIIIVIDALDECQSDVDVRAIIQLLAEVRLLKTVRVRVIISSTSDTLVRCGFGEFPQAENQGVILCNLKSATAGDRDIAVFMGHYFEIMRGADGLAAGWPGEEAMKILVQSADGSFTWAATACRFIQEGQRSTRERLEIIIQCQVSHAEPEEKLDKIYSTILENSIPHDCDDTVKEQLYKMRRVTVGAIATLRSPLSAAPLYRLLQIPKETFEDVIHDLHSVLDVPEGQNRPVRLRHPSLREFLLDKQRCRHQYLRIDEKEVHDTLAKSCLQLLSQHLKSDICNLGASGVLADEIESSAIEKYLSEDIQYACLYWVYHLQKSGARLHDDDEVHKFLQKSLLQWLEALAIMRKMSEGIRAIRILEQILHGRCRSLRGFVQDAKRFIHYNRSTIEEAPLQIYVSAIVYLPEESLVRKLFQGQIPHWLSRLPKTKKYWDSFLQTLDGHSHFVESVVYSPDGKLIASGAADDTVKLWDADIREPLGQLKGHLDTVGAVAFLPDGKTLASASNDGILRVWDTATGAELQVFEDLSAPTVTYAFAPDGSVLAWGSESTIRLYDTTTGELHRVLESNDPTALAFSADSKLIASANYNDADIKVWNWAIGKVKQTIRVDSISVPAYNLAFSPDGAVIASGFDQMLVLWDVTTAEATHRFRAPKQIITVAFSPDGKLLVYGSKDGSIGVWNMQTATQQQTLNGHSRPVKSLAFSPDGTLASTSEDRTVKLWDIPASTPQETDPTAEYSGQVLVLYFSSNNLQVASHIYNGPLCIWNIDTGNLQHQLAVDLSREITTVDFSPTDPLLAIGSSDNKLLLWNTMTGTLDQTLQVDEDTKQGIEVVAFSPDGKLLASGSPDTKLWEISITSGTETGTKKSSGTLKHTLTSLPCSIAIFSPNSCLLATNFWETTTSRHTAICLWSVSSGFPTHTLSGHTDSIRCIAFAPSLMKTMVVSGCSDGTAKLWDCDSGTLLRTFAGPDMSIEGVAFSGEAQFLATISAVGMVKVWDVRTGAEVCEVKVGDRLDRDWISRPRVEFLEDDGGVYLQTEGGVVALDSIEGWAGRRGRHGVVQEAAGLEVAIRQMTSTLDNSQTSRKPGKPAGSIKEILVKSDWVLVGGERMVLLPLEYRPSYLAVRGDVLVQGHKDGRVTFLGFGET